MDYKIIEGGVTAAKGFQSACTAAGIKYKDREDMALIYSQVPCAAAGTFTTNVVKAAPVKWDQDIVYNKPSAQAVVINAGIANACTGSEGYGYCKATADEAAAALGISADSVLVASTGVIGMRLPMDRIQAGIKAMAPKLDGSLESGSASAQAIMTTDTKKKETAVQVELGGKTVTIGGMCKGSGMIHPNMATTLIYVTTDAKVDSALLQPMLKAAADKSFHMLTVDGDTSTNDSLFLFANGASGVAIETEEDKAAFAALLDDICIDMARRIASDGEGATHLMIVEAKGLPTEQDARLVARSIAGSTLFKAAVFGRDANWGRIMAAAGYSGADVDPTKADCILKSAAGEVVVMEAGFGADFSEELAKAVLTEHDITVVVDFHSGDGQATAFGCDLTYDYVKINGDYRS